MFRCASYETSGPFKFRWLSIDPRFERARRRRDARSVRSSAAALVVTLGAFASRRISSLRRPLCWRFDKRSTEDCRSAQGPDADRRRNPLTTAGVSGSTRGADSHRTGERRRIALRIFKATGSDLGALSQMVAESVTPRGVRFQESPRWPGAAVVGAKPPHAS